MKPKSSVAKSDKQKSDALKNLEVNLDDISAFLQQMSKGPEAAKRALQKSLQATEDVLQRRAKNELPNNKPLMRRLKTATRAVARWRAFSVPANRWVAVMLVSYLEGYLEDVLAGIALKHSGVIKKVDLQTARLFQVDSIQELRAEVARSWAHDALRPNGPSTWRRTLRDALGAPKIDDVTIDTIQHLWDTRNLIVHARCVADVPYAKKYSKRGAQAGVAVQVDLKSLQVWLEAMAKFVNWIDAFYLNRTRSG
jgi:hypothetical protein